LAAFRIFFQHASDADRGTRIERALQLADRGDLPPNGLLVCRYGAELKGAMVAFPLPGAAGLCWPPQAVAGSLVVQVEDALLAAALRRFGDGGAKFVQALLNGEELPQSGPLRRHGFSHITTLLYLEFIMHSRPPSTPYENLVFEPYSTCDRTVFHATLMATYVHTLDCHELNGLRTLNDIIEGYRATAGSRVDFWWLVKVDDKPVGVVVTAPSEEAATWELSYLGLVPEARGGGLGTAMANKVVSEILSRGIQRVTLAVDCRNEPARRVYARLGFLETDRREVFLRSLVQPH
jgi:ribosomal protein S18 acetylase RimI-like enzyme